IGVDIIMGNIDAIHQKDLISLFIVMLLVIGTILLFYKELFLSTFDPALSRSYGFSPVKLNFLVMLLTAIVIINGFRSVGLILILNLLIAPVIIARIITSEWKKLFIIATALGVCMSFISIALSRHMLSFHELALSTSGIVSTLYFIIYFTMILLKKWNVLLKWKRKKLLS
ncbi:MAG: metal ABC transporter permease, partial [Chlamydiales bacterium]|nr:metal ABC transporter permease [Chlamydiales bacterium]